MVIFLALVDQPAIVLARRTFPVVAWWSTKHQVDMTVRSFMSFGAIMQSRCVAKDSILAVQDGISK